MNTYTPLIDQAGLGDHLDAKLMFTFFAAFSRFEFALKAAGYLKNGVDAEPNWVSFAEAVEESFRAACESDAALQNAVSFLCEDPPKKQKRDLSWRPVQRQGPLESAKNVFDIVKRIRNNLFHGGKAQRQSADGDRDNRLVRNSLIVLDRALKMDSDVGDAFVTK